MTLRLAVLLAALVLADLLAALALAACAPAHVAPPPAPGDYLADWRGAALFRCLGDDAPPATGAYTSGGDLASCQTLIRDQESRR